MHAPTDRDCTEGTPDEWYVFMRLCVCRTYNVGSGVRFGGDGFVEVLAATQTPTDKEWFQGTADAVRQYAWLFEDIKNRVVEDIIILSGDHL